MRIPRIYLNAALHEGATLPLPDERLNYLKNALRLRDGQAVCVFDGHNHEAAGNLQLGRRDGQIILTQVLERSIESPLHTHLLQAMGKGEKMDWVIQKAIELGVSRITPVATERSVVELKGDRADKRHARFMDIAISACEQSGRNFLPLIDPITPLNLALGQTDAMLKWVLHPESNQASTKFAITPTSAAVLIGPEGGLTHDEVREAIESGFTPLALGQRILRTETAPIVALTLLQARWGDFAENRA